MEVQKVNKGYTLFVSDSIAGGRKRLLRVVKEQMAIGAPFDIMCPTYLDPEGRIFYCGGGITPNEFIPYPDGQGEEDINQYPNIREVEFSPLWFFIISNEALKKLKPLPEFGKDIYNHADFCIKAQKLGLKILVNSKIKVNIKDPRGFTKENKKWIKKLTDSKNKFEKKHKKYLDSKFRLPTMFHSHTGFPGGYCNHARSIIRSLIKKKIRIYYKFVGGCNDDEPLTEDFLVDDLRCDMGSMRMPQVVLSTGLNCFSNSGDYKIGYTTTEVNGIPDDWVRVLNEMDEVWTTSEFAKKSFLASGVKRKIFVMPEGVDPNYFHPDIKAFESNVGKKFLFITNFAWGRRKGVDILFEAFSKEFSDKEDVALVIKALPSYHGHDIKKDMKNLYHRKHSATIVVWDTIMPPYLIGGLYTAGNVFVFPTRGEGFGLPPLEALSCGMPVITTGYSAQTEFLKCKGRKLGGVEFIDYKLEKFDGSDSIYYKGFDWAKPSVSHLRKLMRKMYNEYDVYKQNALCDSEYIRKEWTWDKMADKIIKRLEVINKKIS